MILGGPSEFFREIRDFIHSNITAVCLDKFARYWFMYHPSNVAQKYILKTTFLNEFGEMLFKENDIFLIVND